MSPSRPVRLFLGLPVPVTPVFGEVTQALQDVHPEAKPVPEGTWHVTLRFLGDVDDPAPVAWALEDALKDQAALACTVEGVGAFSSPRHARIVWAGVQADGIEDVARAVIAATADFGQPPERRDFKAHVTLARLRHPVDLSAFVEHHRGTRFTAGLLDRVVLWRSTLTPIGPEYRPVTTVWLPEP